MRHPLTISLFFKQTFRVNRFPSLVLMSICWLNAGCGSQTDIQYAPVRGKVLLEGEPLSGATVVFVPQRNAKTANVGQMSFGKTDSTGTFTLATPKRVSGAVVGMHKVSISTGISDPATNEVIEPETLPPEYNSNTILEFEVPRSGTDAAFFSLQKSNGKKKP